MSGSARAGRDPEYDRFGPWVLEISADDPPPPRFVPYLKRHEEPLVSIKVPRKIARRDATPGMDLYDYVVSLYEKDMVVLKRDSDHVRERTIAYGDVKYVATSEELLRGNLHLGIPDSPYDLPYNTVSGDLMRRVVGLVRERFRPAGGEKTASLPRVGELGELSFYFERLLRDEHAQDSGMRPLAAQADAALGDLETSSLRRAFLGVVDKRILESVHLSDGHDLWVIDRGQPYAYRWQTTYGRREVIVPLANISGVRWDDEPTEGDTTSTLTVSTRAGDRSWVFTTDNESLAPYARWLDSLPLPTRRG